MGACRMYTAVVQMLYTAWQINNETTNLPSSAPLCKSTGLHGYQNHPMTKWICESRWNYNHAVKIGTVLALEYKRYHSCTKHIIWLSRNLPKFTKKGKTPKGYNTQFWYNMDSLSLEQLARPSTICDVICTAAKNQTKEWRNDQPWYQGGKKNECEKTQVSQLKEITGEEIKTKTNIRLNTETHEFVEDITPLTKTGGFYCTEDFDIKWRISSKEITYLGNLKMICTSGGAQTRSMREVNHFINAQLDYLLKHNDSSIRFINILEGDRGHKYTFGNYKKN